jgi:hypothetical protein
MSQFCRADAYPLFPLPGYVPPSPVVPSGFVPQAIQFLSSVTQLTGTDFTALASIPTGGLVLPYCVEFINSNDVQQWTLQVGTSATGPGLQRPNDYSATNQRVWVQTG